MTTNQKIIGACHCGKVAVEITLVFNPASYEPRICDCDFCRMHGGSYISDPKGSLRFIAQNGGNIRRYRQGSDLADMLFCANCGVLLGACYQEARSMFGAVNTKIFTEKFGLAKVVSPKLLNSVSKVERWKQLWFSHVEFTE